MAPKQVSRKEHNVQDWPLNRCQERNIMCKTASMVEGKGGGGGGGGGLSVKA